MTEETQPNRLGTLFSGASVKKPATRARTFLFPDSPAEDVKQNTGTQSGKNHKQPTFFNQGSLPAVVTDNLKVQSLGMQNSQKFPVDVIPQSNPRRRNVLGKTMSGFLNTNTGAGLSSTFVFPYSSQPFQPIQISGHTRVNSLGSSRGFLNPLKTLDSKVGVSVPPNHLSEFKR